MVTLQLGYEGKKTDQMEKDGFDFCIGDSGVGVDEWNLCIGGEWTGNWIGFLADDKD